MNRRGIIVIVLILGFLSSFAYAENPISAVSRSTAKADLKASLMKVYDSSYSTVEMLLNAGMEDYDKLCDIPSSGVNDKILKELSDTYYPSFSTIYMLFEANKESYDRLQSE